MKYIARTIIFSAISIAVTMFVIKGFVIPLDPKSYIIATLLLAFVYYIVKPLTKLILLPLNILTLGLVSLVAYIAIFYVVSTKFALAHITPWVFNGYHVSYLVTIVLSALVYSFVINLLNKFI